ncbi:MAG: prefoldin subunit beta [Thermoplasmata archaeon]|nr:MAG: prefoldin subunit beta [Thermoplasmata archaeon]
MAGIPLPPKLQDRLTQYEQIKSQLEVVLNQRVQLETLQRETESALNELKDLEEGSKVYKGAGSLLIEVKDPVKLKEELKEELESLQVRITSLKKQEETLRKKMEELAQWINQEIARLSGGDEGS